MTLTDKLLNNKYVKRYGRLFAIGLVVIIVGVVLAVVGYRHNHPSQVAQTAQATTQTSDNTSTTPSNSTPAQPQTVEQAFPNAQQLTLNESHTDGALSYKFTSVQPNYSDAKQNSETSSLNPYSGQGIPGADATLPTYILVTIQFANNTGRTACENVLTTCPDGGPKYDFGCVYNSDGLAAKVNPGATGALDNTAESSSIVFNPDLIEPTTYPNTSLLDKGSVIYNGGTYTETVELTSDCVAVGNATGSVYMKLN